MTNFCVDCRWYRKPAGFYQAGCASPLNGKDAVTGATIDLNPSFARTEKGECGLDAAHFEPKQPWSLWKLLFGGARP